MLHLQHNSLVSEDILPMAAPASVSEEEKEQHGGDEAYEEE